MDERRLARLQPKEMTQDQLGLYNEILGGRRSAGPQRFSLVGEDGALEGPFNAMLLSPSLGSALQGLGTAVRYGSGLNAEVREACILMVAAKWECAFEQHAHEQLARDAGLSEEALRVIRGGGVPATDDGPTASALLAAKLLIDLGDLGDSEYERYVSVLGEATLFELSTLIGYYSTLALQLRLFRI